MHIYQRIALSDHLVSISCTLNYTVTAILFLLFSVELYAQPVELSQQEKELYAQQLLVKAMTQGFLGYHDKAIPLYIEALNVNPSSATINSALAESYEHLGEFTSALFHASQALSIEPGELHFNRHLVRLHIQSGDNAMAEQSLVALIEQFPNDAESLGDLTEIQALNGKLDRALETNDRLIELQGPQANLLETKLELLKALKNWEAYETVLLEREQLNPASIQYKKERAEFYVERDRLQEAIDLLNDVIPLSPADPVLSSMLSDLYKRSGDTEKAQSLQDNLSITVDDPDVAYQNAVALYDSANDNAATLSTIERMLRSALEVSPDHGESLILLGTVLIDQQQFAEAGPYLKKALNINPRDINLWIAAITSYLTIHEYNEAYLISEDALLLFPGQLSLLRLSTIASVWTYNNSTALERSTEYLELASSISENEAGRSNEAYAEMHAYAGLTAAKFENFDHSDVLFNQALELAPNSPEILGLRALSLAERSVQLNEAINLARRSVELSPENALFKAILGRVYFISDDLNNAEKWITEALGSETTAPIAFEYQGDLFLKKGSPQEALSSWNKALKFNPDNPVLLEKINVHAN